MYFLPTDGGMPSVDLPCCAACMAAFCALDLTGMLASIDGVQLELGDAAEQEFILSAEDLDGEAVLTRRHLDHADVGGMEDLHALSLTSCGFTQEHTSLKAQRKSDRRGNALKVDYVASVVRCASIHGLKSLNFSGGKSAQLPLNVIALSSIVRNAGGFLSANSRRMPPMSMETWSCALR